MPRGDIIDGLQITMKPKERSRKTTLICGLYSTTIINIGMYLLSLPVCRVGKIDFVNSVQKPRLLHNLLFGWEVLARYNYDR